MSGMRQFLRTAGATLALVLLGAFAWEAPAVSALAPVNNLALTSESAACAGLNQIGSNSCGVSNGKIVDNNGSGSVNSIVRGVVTILSYVVGIVAIIMILLAGFRYMTSAGDSNKVSSAKSTLIYALIGLAIAGIAQVIVQFALSASNNAVNPPAKQQKK